MNKKNLLIFLIIVLGLSVLKSDFCLAKLNNPENLEVSAVGEGSAILKWEWYENSGILKQFKVLYKDKNSTYWIPRYPDANAGIITYNLTALSENTTYQWRVSAEAENTDDYSDFVDGPDFTTTQAPAPPPPNGNGNGGIIGPIKLRNPLNQDSLWDAINAVIDFLIVLAFAIAPILIIYSASLMLFAAGDATKVNRAKSIISWTLIAVAIVLFAKGLPSVIKGMFSN